MNERNNLPKSDNTRDDNIIDSELLDTLIHVHSACQAHEKEQVTLEEIKDYFRKEKITVSRRDLVGGVKKAIEKGYVRFFKIYGANQVYLQTEGKRLLTQNLQNYNSQQD